jgi:hypothetical protein
MLPLRKCSKHNVEMIELTGESWSPRRRRQDGEMGIRICPVCHHAAIARMRLEVQSFRRKWRSPFDGWRVREFIGGWP